MAANILINSHRRSGTHFLIDSIRANVQDAWFPNHFLLPADFNIGSLFGKDEKVYKIFKKYLNEDRPVIIKSHLLPEEMNIENPKDKFEQLIKDTFQQSKKIYIYRNGKDTLVSLYHFLKPGVDFHNFLETKNDHIIRKIRTEQAYDENRVRYWGYHVEEWKKVEDVCILKFEDLKNNYTEAIKSVCDFINEPPQDPVKKPQIPRFKLLHGIQKKMSNLGITPLPASSSVRPRKGKVGDSDSYFTKELDTYFKKQLEHSAI
ncbi:sulfotransferase domain-containing protein [Rhodohalobacter sp. 614A]|uniref:sulfotransferase domain-containing protein n=1 Tax=Rhodohalobacter sp. 614A TaxID=2908649 RepID=UPI001F371F0E|nr:sulfotransferase domain-containing protein [Rhodohalobacter sp. 614A]